VDFLSSATLISIPLGVAKAVREGTRFDLATTFMVLVGYAIPGFVLGVLLIVLFCRRHLLRLVSAARHHVGQLRRVVGLGQGEGLPLAHGAAADLPGDPQFCRGHAADQEHLCRRDPKAVRAGGAQPRA
jgi:hypothetical protein